MSELLAAGESESLEFKSTARWNIVAGMADKKIEQVVVKTVCGFLNSRNYSGPGGEPDLTLEQQA
jgi:hypothetical protein